MKRNLQRKKITFSDGTVRTMYVRASDLKAGKYPPPAGQTTKFMRRPS